MAPDTQQDVVHKTEGQSNTLTSLPREVLSSIARETVSDFLVLHGSTFYPSKVVDMALLDKKWARAFLPLVHQDLRLDGVITVSAELQRASQSARHRTALRTLHLRLCFDADDAGEREEKRLRCEVTLQCTLPIFGGLRELIVYEVATQAIALDDLLALLAKLTQLATLELNLWSQTLSDRNLVHSLSILQEGNLRHSLRCLLMNYGETEEESVALHRVERLKTKPFPNVRSLDLGTFMEPSTLARHWPSIFPNVAEITINSPLDSTSLIAHRDAVLALAPHLTGLYFDHQAEADGVDEVIELATELLPQCRRVCKFRFRNMQCPERVLAVIPRGIVDLHLESHHNYPSKIPLASLAIYVALRWKKLEDLHLGTPDLNGNMEAFQVLCRKRELRAVLVLLFGLVTFDPDSTPTQHDCSSWDLPEPVKYWRDSSHPDSDEE